MCPRCKAVPRRADDSFACGNCGASFPIRGGVPVLIHPDSPVLATDRERIEFWDQGWQVRCAAEMAETREQILERKAKALEFRRAYGLEQFRALEGRKGPGSVVLNIGCGGGGREGMNLVDYAESYIGIDTSLFAAQSTQTLLQRAGFNAVAVQGEGERLPFSDASIDMVYSWGVLHHTPRTEDAVREVHRVLKPGGVAVIGLYATHSVHFWNYRLRAALAGNLSDRAYGEWLHSHTEGGWNTDGRKNKWTTTYSAKSFSALLRSSGFSHFSLDKCYASILDFPILGKIAPKILPAPLLDRKLVKFGGIIFATCAKPA